MEALCMWSQPQSCCTPAKPEIARVLQPHADKQLKVIFDNAHFSKGAPYRLLSKEHSFLRNGTYHFGRAEAEHYKEVKGLHGRVR